MDAKTIYYTALGGIAIVGTAIAEALGGWDTSLKVLIIFMAIDYITGILCALVWKKSPKSESGAFESKASLKGLIRKCAVLILVYIGALLDELTEQHIVRTAVIIFFIANDGFSIIENLGIMGVPMPEAIKNAFELLQMKKDDTGKK
jgi:toxin secretion/phage lysis holin